MLALIILMFKSGSISFLLTITLREMGAKYHLSTQLGEVEALIFLP